MNFIFLHIFTTRMKLIEDTIKSPSPPVVLFLFIFSVSFLVLKLYATLDGDKESLVRKRKRGETVTEWLIGEVDESVDDDGFTISLGGNCAPLETNFDIRQPPRLNPFGISHLFGIFSFVRDIVITPDPVVINAPIETVWKVRQSTTRMLPTNQPHGLQMLLFSFSLSGVDIV